MQWHCAIGFSSVLILIKVVLRAMCMCRLQKQVDFHPTWKLSSADWWWTETWWQGIPDERPSECKLLRTNVEVLVCKTPMMLRCRTQVSTIWNVGDCYEGILKLWRTSSTDWVEGKDGHLVLDYLLPRKPVKNVMEDRCNMPVSLGTNDRTNSNIHRHLEPMDKCRAAGWNTRQLQWSNRMAMKTVIMGWHCLYSRTTPWFCKSRDGFLLFWYTIIFGHGDGAEGT